MFRLIKLFAVLMTVVLVGCAVDINPGSGAISVTPRSKDFGEVSIGESVQVTLKLRNNTAEELYVTEMEIVGTNANDFMILSGGSVPLSLSPEVDYDVIVSFSPTAEGALEAQLEITYDGDSKTKVKLTGFGRFGDNIVLVPGTVDFENVLLGEVEQRELTISNGTDEKMIITNIYIQGLNPDDFYIVSGGVTPTDVLAKTTHTVIVEFSPIEIGLREALFVVEYDGASEPLQSVFTGNGVLASGFEITPMSYDFGEVGINASVNVDFMITNTGNTDLIISVIEITDDAETQYEITDGQIFSDLTLIPGGTHEFTVTFTPTSVGQKTAKLSITHSGDSVPFQGDLSGNGSELLGISPFDHDFGSVNVGNSSSPFVFTITNPTSSDVIVKSINFDGADASAFDYSISGTLPFMIPANGGSLEIEVTFQPTKDGSHTAALNVTIDGSTSPLIAQIAGTGSSSPEFAISPTGKTFDFGIIPFNTSKSADFTVTNIGSGTLSLTSIKVQNDAEGNFSIESGGSSADITTGSHVIKIKFSPVSIGPKTATLRIEHTANGSPYLITLTGEAATVNISPTSHNFGDVVVGGGTPPSKTFVVTNSTANTVTITNISITGTDAAEFSASPSGTMSQIVPPGGTMNIVVKCDPSKIGALSASLSITHSLGNLSATLIAKGTGRPELKVTPPGTTSFGTLTLKTPGESKTGKFVAENVGSGILSITSISISGTDVNDFTITSGGSAVDLGPGDKHTIFVKFEPTHYGQKKASLKFVHKGVAPASPYYIPLIGNAVGPDFILIPDVVAYSMGDAPIKKIKRKGFYIKNNGNQTLIISSIAISNTTDFSLEHANPRNLSAGDITYFYLDFIPQSVGNKGATLTINHNSTNAPHRVTISGSGIATPNEIDEDFEGGKPSGWGSTGIWQFGTPTNSGPSSAHSGSICFGTNISGNYIPNQYCFVITPVLDMSVAMSPKMSFYMYVDTYHYTYSSSYYNCGWVEISTDGGNTWSRNLSPSPSYNSTAVIAGSNANVWGGYYGDLFRQWRKVDIDLSSAAGKSGVQIAFYFYSGSLSSTRSGWYVDDVKIWDDGKPYPNTPCPQDNDITTKVTSNKYTLKWDCQGATSYDVYFGTANPPTSKVGSNLKVKQQTVSVAANKKYFWRVEAKTSTNTYKSQVYYFETVTSHSKVLINEIDTGSVDWIEFYNPGSTLVYIGGYQCTIYSDNKSSPDGTFTVPMYYYLKPGETIVFHDMQASSYYSNRVDFDFDWDNSAQAVEIILQKHSFYPNTGVDYMKVNTLASHKPTDLTWSGSATSNNTTWYNWYRNSSTDSDSYTDWTVRRYTSDKDSKNPGQ